MTRCDHCRTGVDLWSSVRCTSPSGMHIATPKAARTFGGVIFTVDGAIGGPARPTLRLIKGGLYDGRT